jgi:glycosyltransferase involved in cell wall biosynthesis
MNLKSPMTISFLTTSFPRYEGDYAGNFILKIACGIAKLGAQVEIVAPDTQDASPLSLPPEISLTRFKYFFPRSAQKVAYGTGIANRLKQKRWSLFQIPFLFLAFIIATLRSSRKSQVLHAFWSLAGIVSVVVSLIKPKPIVITLWGSDIFFLKTPILSTIFKSILERADVIICENQHFKNQLTKLSNNNIFVIPNGIDLEQFKPRDKLSARATLKLPENKLIILSTGSLTKNKGHKYLIHALSDLLQTRDDIHLCIVGSGEEHESLAYEIKELNLDRKIDLVGSVSNEMIATWLNAADIFVLPSLHEGTPNSLLEAMATGLPSVASATGGIPEIIDDGSNGFLVTPANSKEIKAKLSQLIESSELRDRLGTQARLKLESDFGSWEVQAKQLHGIYQELLNKTELPHNSMTNSMDASFKVLTVYYKHKPGGFCKRLQMKINAYLEQGWKVHYVAVELFPYKHPNLIPHILPTPFKNHNTLLFWIYFFTLAPWFTAWVAYREKVQLISIFSLAYACLCAPAKWITGSPILTFIRTMKEKREFTFGNYTIIYRLKRLLDKFGIAISDSLVANSESIKTELTELGETKVPIIYNNITESKLDRPEQRKEILKEFGLQEESFLVVTTGLLIARKNIQCLIRAFAKVDSNKAVLLIIGEGPLLKTLQDLVKQLGLKDRVIFTGWREDVMKILPGCDLFVFPSYLEGLSNSLLEAMACGLPCLVSDIPENAEIITPPQQRFPADQDETLSAMIDEVLHSSEKLEFLHNSTLEDRKRYIFNWEKKITAIAEEVVNRH